MNSIKKTPPKLEKNFAKVPADGMVFGWIYDKITYAHESAVSSGQHIGIQEFQLPDALGISHKGLYQRARCSLLPPPKELNPLDRLAPERWKPLSNASTSEQPHRKTGAYRGAP